MPGEARAAGAALQASHSGLEDDTAHGGTAVAGGTNAQPGGSGGGGAGARGGPDGGDGTTNTGGGGGGSNCTSYPGRGGNGGSGIVMIRYKFQ